MDFSSANTVFWEPFLQLGVLSIILLVTNIVQRKIKLFQKIIFPTGILMGFVILFLRTKGILELNVIHLETIAYHALAIGSIAFALRVPTKGLYSSSLTGLKSGALILSTQLVTALAGLAVTITLGLIALPGLHKATGIALPMIYMSGPNLASFFGGAFRAVGMPTPPGNRFGFSLAIISFIITTVIGIILLNIFKLTGRLRKPGSEMNFESSVTIDAYLHEKELPFSKSLDRGTLQFALILLVYLGTYWVVHFMCYALYIISPAISNAIGPMLWGFHFLVGLILAIALRKVLQAFQVAELMTYQVQNNYLLGRIAGVAFDVMMITGIASINLDNLVGYNLLFVALAVVGPIPASFFVYFVCKKLYPDYATEGFFSMYGTLMSGLASGILLLREVDPEFKTPAATNLVSGSVYGLLLGIPAPIMAAIASHSAIRTYVIFVLYIIYILILLYVMFKAGKKKRS